MNTHSLILGLVLTPLAVALLACKPTPEPSPPVTAPISEIPEHLAELTDGWREVVDRNFKAALADHRASHYREFRWTPSERTELDATRSEARQHITNASAEDRPWLVAAYVEIFVIHGYGREWLDTILDMPPGHPAWAGSSLSLLEITHESDNPEPLRAFIRAVATAHDRPVLRAASLYLDLEDADRASDWDRAKSRWAQLESLLLPHPHAAPASAVVYLDPANQLDPQRPLRADTQIPNFCAPAIAGPRAGERVCLSQLFPHDQPTLIIGWATWCQPCNEQLPKVIELVRGRPLRVIAISKDNEAELALTHLREHGVDDNWTVLLPRLERPNPRDGMSLDLRPIPYMALVDGGGRVDAGPPWLDAEALAARLP